MRRTRLAANDMAYEMALEVLLDEFDVEYWLDTERILEDAIEKVTDTPVYELDEVDVESIRYHSIPEIEEAYLEEAKAWAEELYQIYENDADAFEKDMKFVDWLESKMANRPINNIIDRITHYLESNIVLPVVKEQVEETL